MDLFGGEGARARLEASHARLSALAQAEGLPLSPRTMTYNSRLAQELGSWAEEQGLGRAFDARVFRATFADGANIGDVDVLVELAADVGLDPDAARHVLGARTHRSAVDADWARAGQNGVTAVPTFVAGGYRVVGAQPYEILERLVVAAGAVRRAPTDPPDR